MKICLVCSSWSRVFVPFQRMKSYMVDIVEAIQLYILIRRCGFEKIYVEKLCYNLMNMTT